MRAGAVRSSEGEGGGRTHVLHLVAIFFESDLAQIAQCSHYRRHVCRRAVLVGVATPVGDVHAVEVSVVDVGVELRLRTLVKSANF